MISRRLFVQSALAAALGGPALANAPAVSLRPVARDPASLISAGGGLKGVLARAGLSGEVACAVADVKTGLRLEAEGAQSALPPASVAKALTALYALDTLGAGHRFTTQLIATGTLSGGVLTGDLVLVGGGDPMLNTDHLAQMARQLKTAGLREVRGNFRYFEGALPAIHSIDPDQPDHVGYSPALSGLALNFNRVHFEWKRAGQGWAVTMDARTQKYRPEVAVAQMAVAKRKLPVYSYQDRKGADHWTVANAALGKGGSRWLPVRKPGAYAADVLRTMVRANGIALRAPKVAKNRPNGHVLATHQSPPLDVMLKATLKFSNNLMAEMIGLAATQARGGRPRSLRESAADMNRWAAATYGVKGAKLVDHSGLGAASRITAADMVTTLIAAHRQGALKPLLKGFALRDSKGRVVKNHPIKVAAKTGTLNFVSGLGGFMTAADGTELAFAIFSADKRARAGIKRADRERPPGARSWNRQAKRVQQQLIERWGRVYGS
ncbi:D-alanyl-D-alanine carboxypeptidase/D-alanyl-D-alanine-endopeptidase [Phaeobacter sp.]|uniref:D-alanyl-D-alanine carboxypeptidase/D-alanyl-D-alanine endopeptidase n=1 Tax=Phaeobacter sp. TaxID=1902409 RepID=UPI0025F4F8DD|nr:D-alanyl-D-alanine carboxypeptidase/D-alanyl-D-alanine-endopeptidase [Phaeobacter sp.]